ncbi:MAG TPA: hypothetical protein VFC46_16430, partial [Humisphaera sp.]|nr:hypothetical protein [Humisphaera sp.]
MSRASLFCCSLAFVACLLAPSNNARAEKAAAELLPKSVAFYVEMNHPTELMDLILDHPLRKTVEQSDAYRRAIAGDGYQKFMAILGVVEERAGVKWRPAIDAMAGAGIVLAFDPATNGVILLARPKDAAVADKVRDAFFGLARTDAQNNGKP